MLEVPYDPPDVEVRKWAMFCHLGGLTSAIIPCTNMILPLIIWLNKRHLDPYIDEQGKESINFQLTMILYGLIVGFAVYILKFILIGYLFLWLPLLILIAQLGGSIVGAIRAYDGEKFRYPFILRFL